MDLLQNEWFRWGIALVFLTPIVVVLLGELINTAGQRDRTLRPPLRLIRGALVPLGVLVIVLVKLMEVSEETTLIKVLETVLWILGINALIGLANRIVFADNAYALIQSKVPQLFLDIFRVLMVGLGAAIVLSAVWGANLGELVTALGLGSFVIGLALQDTLGNLFSGIALLYEKPFSEGDVIRVNDLQGRVVEMNWRAIRLLTRERELVVIPHLIIGQGSIVNYSRPETFMILKTELGFGHEVAPNEVKQILMRILRNMEQVLEAPEPEVKTMRFDDHKITYEVEFAIPTYEKNEEILDELMTRIWYATRRHAIKLPQPQLHLHRPSTEVGPVPSGPLELVKQHLPLDSAQLQQLDSDGIHQQTFGRGEFIIHAGDKTGTLYIVLRGEAEVLTTRENGSLHRISRLREGDFFGEIALFTNKTSALSVRALSDLDTVVLQPEAVIRMVDQSPKLAHYLDKVMDARRAAARN